jgi:hypothetical protein
MAITRDRSTRRYFARKAKDKVRKWWWVGRSRYFDSLAGDPKWVGKAARTPRSCSCWACGNPRKYFSQRTRQEIQADEKQAASTW